MKIVALALLAVPIAFVSVLLVAETVGGGLGVSFGHVIQLLPLLLLAILAWWRPLIAGWILVVLGGAIAIASPVLMQRLPVAVVVTVEPILLLPVAAGILLVAAGRRRVPPASPGTSDRADGAG